MNGPTASPPAGTYEAAAAQHDAALAAAARTASPKQFTEQDWRAVRKLMGSMPYGAGLTSDPYQVNTPEALIRWLAALSDRLESVNGRHTAEAAELAAAKRIIDAGRTAYAALMEAPGSPILGKL